MSRRCFATPRAPRRLACRSPSWCERPDGVEFRRTVLADQGVGGHALDLALPASAPTGTWHVQAFTDPKRPPVGETTFLVEDYVPDRIEFDLTSPAKSISQNSPADIDVAGRFLYGAPASALSLDGEMTIAAATGTGGLCRLCVRLWPMRKSSRTQQTLDDLPATDAAGKAKFPVSLDKLPTSTHPLRGADHRAHGGARRPRRRAQADAAGRGRQPT